MKALITGAGGQLGRALSRTVPTGWECVELGRGALDLRDRNAVRSAVEHHKPAVVLNAAAYTAVDRAEAEAETAFAINGEAVGVLAEQARAAGAHLVHISSDFVFDGLSPRAYRPSDPRSPLSVYGRSKTAGEDAAGDEATIVRTAWVYSADGANFVKTMLGLMRSRSEIAVVADQIGAPTWANSLAQALWGLAAIRAGGIWHYSDAGVASWYDFAVAIFEEAQAAGLLSDPVAIRPIPTAAYPTPARRPAFSLLDSSLTLEALGMAAVHWRVHLRTMLAEIAALSR